MYIIIQTKEILGNPREASLGQENTSQQKFTSQGRGWRDLGATTNKN